jgi:hypothetical protein
MNMTETKTAEYVYVIYGAIPELMPRVACRTVGCLAPMKLKNIKCPYCKEDLIEVVWHTTVDLYRLPARKPVKCHMVRQCEICNGEVGMYIR